MAKRQTAEAATTEAEEKTEAAATKKKKDDKREFTNIRIKRDLKKELAVFAGGQDVNEFAAKVLQEYMESNLLKKKKLLEKKKQELEEELKQLEAKLAK